MWPSLLKIQYTELKVSCGNDPVIKNYICSNSDHNLWPNDPKINTVLPLPQGNNVVKFGKDPIYRTKNQGTPLSSNNKTYRHDNNWNIVESGVTRHNPKNQSLVWFYIRNKLTKVCHQIQQSIHVK
jgi:hypothetical protein